MPSPTRYTGLDVSVFTINATAFVADLENCDVEYMSKTKEAKGIKDRSDYPWGVGQNLKVTGNLFLTGSTLPAMFGTSQTFTLVTGGLSYTGTFLITKGKSTHKREEIDMLQVTLESQGDFTIT